MVFSHSQDGTGCSLQKAADASRARTLQASGLHAEQTDPVLLVTHSAHKEAWICWLAATARVGAAPIAVTGIGTLASPAATWVLREPSAGPSHKMAYFIPFKVDVFARWRIRHSYQWIFVNKYPATTALRTAFFCLHVVDESRGLLRHNASRKAHVASDFGTIQNTAHLPYGYLQLATALIPPRTAAVESYLP
ncbi:hypothetical protein S7711_10975 [Stachybotrys chartarum IBT 7711]|uniref:Uncharacterized protein n=1 Tax=Stachybotrys chartarum (strain CBS 109288 / IBT 7711) TaxID=1280523 RepID=A0A084B1J3_STACB|nr:hypothetical protein S7711_10975 [Stachybotrys chartarum IBT 7711]KFA50733.1 hypothetical protein S40293_11223 [Stachybotrys chartarum IBT 40293]